MATTRRLAAMPAADVAGYSRLMGADEEGTHERLKRIATAVLAEEHGSAKSPRRQKSRRRSVPQRKRPFTRGFGSAGW